MKPMSPEEKELEEMGAEVSARYRDGADAEPSARIDAAILEAARREAARPRVRNWHVPAAVAAVLVIGVSLSLRTRDDFGTLPPPEAPARAPVELAKATAPSLEPQASESKAAPAAKQKYDQLARPSRERSERSGRDTEGRDAHDMAARETAQEAARADEREASAPPAAAQQDAQAPPAAAQKDAQAPAAGAQSNVQPPVAAQSRPRVLAEEAQAPPAVAQTPAAAPAPAPEEALAAKKAARDEADPGRRVASLRKKEGAAAGSFRNADDWIRAMEALLRDGKKEDARLQFAEFRKRYPDYKLPASLNDLEREAGAAK